MPADDPRREPLSVRAVIKKAEDADAWCTGPDPDYTCEEKSDDRDQFCIPCLLFVTLCDLSLGVAAEAARLHQKEILQLQDLAREIGTVSSVAQRPEQHDKQMIKRLDEWRNRLFTIAALIEANERPNGAEETEAGGRSLSLAQLKEESAESRLRRKFELFRAGCRVRLSDAGVRAFPELAGKRLTVVANPRLTKAVPTVCVMAEDSAVADYYHVNFLELVDD